MGIYEELEWRGLIKDVSDPSIKEKLNKGGLTFYIGTDPTGDSLHIGHFSSFLISKRLKDAGHHPILLVGGGTGLIGDPKPDAERPMITYEQVEHNFNALKTQATNLFGFEVVNNGDWLKKINIIDYLRDVGKYFNVGSMLGKDIVRRRLDEGITFTEFSYMTLQAYDFEYLYENKGVTLEVAGQDQWGNITAGIDLIRKKLGKTVYGFTMPLLTKSDGTKFGKTNGKAIWLDRNKTSPFEMYQFFVNCEDSKVIDYLKFLTFLSKEEIEELERKNNEHPELREAHKALAKEVITFIHGKEAYEEALATANSLFASGTGENAPTLKLEEADLLDGSVDICSILVKCGFASSRGEARRAVEQGGVSVDDNKITDSRARFSKEDLQNGILVRKGKKNFKKVTL
jgi:tyrosyl-tRNA synthetase